MRQFSVVFDPSLWPKPRAAVGAIDMGRYGLDELKKLHERFASRLDSWEMLRLEYSQLLPMLPRVFQTTIKAREPTVQDVMCELVKEDKSVSFPNCSHLLAIALVLPVATAERGFSTMKRIKTALRNRMEGTKLLSLMVISIQGVETQDMKFRPAVETWFGLRKRRITPGVFSAPLAQHGALPETLCHCAAKQRCCCQGQEIRRQEAHVTHCQSAKLPP